MVVQRITNQPGRRARFNLVLGIAAVLLLFVVSGLIAYLNTRVLRRNADLIADTHEILITLADIVSIAKDAETGQRGFVITGNESYLDPYEAAVAEVGARLDHLETLTADRPNQQVRLQNLRRQVDVKLRELADTIAVRRANGFEAARAIVISDRGKAAMDAIRNEVQAMQHDERALRLQRIAEMDSAYRIALASGTLTGLVGALLTGVVGYLLWQASLTRWRQDWLQAGQIKVSEMMGGEQRLEQLGENVLRFLAEYLDAHAGAFFAKQDGVFHRVATYGVPALGGSPATFDLNDGLLGQAVKDRRTIIVHDVPEGYLTVGSALGRGKPRQLVILPVTEDRHINAVIELGFVHPLTDSITELFERITETIGVAVRSVNYREHLQRLLEETQRQTEELETQGEELRVSNEELEVQSRALRESQSRLENQHAELEQTNAQLEEQTQLLEAQRDEVSRAKNSLETQAHELEQASQYKSDFLANMSHELRTPLNSSLILAKLLADNPAGNLTLEQVRYAETIQAAGNDLLTLINDILDLSKIEAGHMEVRPEPIPLRRLMDDIGRIFQPVAEHKGLTFRAQIAPDCPETIQTDRQRLEQVLKNLLSNAIKFTERGTVELGVRPTDDDRIAFAIVDSGIGIAQDQQQIIFEAFRQADGTTNRKYGGTGLGLAISRELARLLGGEIQIKSEPGQGSTFTAVLPRVYDASLVQTRAASNLGVADSVVTTGKLATAAKTTGRAADTVANSLFPGTARAVADDRQHLTSDRRVILVVEDDESFARILSDLAHELGFHCLIASTAEEGFASAVQFLPSAVVLDLGLPDHPGLWVLDRIKHDRRTRHLPVHVVSASDFSQLALKLGAASYMLKPVKRDELANALTQLEDHLEQRLKRVILVEDDPVQLESLNKLLKSQDVETVGVASASQCLEKLRAETFDCMVLDLSLPDASGFSLLETLSREDAYSFPPAIVYTGRDLSADEEQRLRRYSKSIIIKGAKSPERLLDEVTLFLHQVVSKLPPEQQRMLEKARSRDAALEGRRILIVEDDVRNIFALTSILEPRGALAQIARNGREALDALEKSESDPAQAVDLVLMDVMMPEMDGITAVREIRKRAEWKKLPIIMLTAKAMRGDQEHCLEAGANDYIAKPLDVEKLLSLIRVWLPR